MNTKAIVTVSILFVGLFVMSQKAYSQCNCETINRDDGVTIKTCESKLVVEEDSHSVAISLLYDGVNYYVAANALFRETPQNLTGNLMIRFSNSDMITFTGINYQMAFIGGRELAQAIYRIENFVLNTLTNENLYTMSYRFEDQLLRTNEVSENNEVLKENFKCLQI